VSGLQKRTDDEAEEQIVAVLRERDAGAKTAGLARRHGISEATLYNRKAKRRHGRVGRDRGKTGTHSPYERGQLGAQVRRQVAGHKAIA